MNYLTDKEWWKATGTRAVKTVAQSGVALIGTTAVVMPDVDWIVVGSGALLSGLLSVLTSVSQGYGLPEVINPEVAASEEIASMVGDDDIFIGDELINDITDISDDEV